jgi:hypothetical protein
MQQFSRATPYFIWLLGLVLVWRAFIYIRQNPRSFLKWSLTASCVLLGVYIILDIT